LRFRDAVGGVALSGLSPPFIVPAGARWSGAASAGSWSLVLQPGEFVGVGESISMGVFVNGIVYVVLVSSVK